MATKILHIIESLAVGGAERLLVGIIRELKDYENHLVILNDPETLKRDISQEVPFTNLHVNGWFDLFAKARDIRRYIGQHQIDIVHSHLYRANIIARRGTPAAVPLLNSIHAVSSLASYKVKRATLYLERLTYKKRHTIIGVSKEVLEDFDRYVGIKGRSEVLYNFIEDRFFEAARKTHFSTSPLRLVAVGNLRHQKNYPYLIEAFKKMPTGVEVDIFGEGHMREELEKAITDFRLPIRLLGVRPDIDKVLPGYDAFIMPSFYEGQPVALLEAMACGLPALLADVPVLREIGRDHAVYFNLANPEDLVRRIRQITAGEIDLAAISKSAFAFVEGFARTGNYMNKLRQIYQSHC